jgi:hypothetical protein
MKLVSLNKRILIKERSILYLICLPNVYTISSMNRAFTQYLRINTHPYYLRSILKFITTNKIFTWNMIVKGRSTSVIITNSDQHENC